ncbi:hypothetical protein HanXRQr2_Chr10g0437641 [Helianthus annuus]|uniref:Uncharacterized protein n=1 Tax=Helianthus annuus TaxID=4232 RepID=A0A9K3N4H3_HELAN|nr:hypothetical protein HanXRQr2_Chr10g0437641 [Helianthus annuus]
MLKISKRGSNNHNMKRDKKSRNRNGDSQVTSCSSGVPTNGVWPNGLSSTKPQNNGLPCNYNPLCNRVLFKILACRVYLTLIRNSTLALVMCSL